MSCVTCATLEATYYHSADDFVIQDWLTTWSQATANAGAVVAPTSASLDVQPYVDNLIPRTDLQNGRHYYFVVRLTNSMQQHALLSSDGTFYTC